jgi:hypothetical protein
MDLAAQAVKLSAVSFYFSNYSGLDINIQGWTSRKEK